MLRSPEQSQQPTMQNCSLINALKFPFCIISERQPEERVLKNNKDKREVK